MGTSPAVVGGLDRDLAAKQAAKYDPEREAEARDWISQVLNRDLSKGNFQELLKDGVILCQLMNRVYPEANVKPNSSTMPFKQMENIGQFLSAMSRLGVPPHESFQTVDLYENKNPAQVVDAIFALSRHAVKKGFDGPLLGPKLAEKHHVSFSQEKINEGKTIIGLQMGFNGGANASGINYGSRRDIGGHDLGK